MAQNIDVSIIPQSYLPEIKVSENDNSLRVIRVSIIDENGEAYQIPSGVTATFAGTKPSGLGFTVPCTIDGSAVQFVMEDTVCNEAGRFPAEIRLINGEARIGTCNVLMNVEPNPHPDDTTDGDREPLVNEITALLHAIEEQAEQVAEDTRIVEQAMDAWTNMSAEATTLPAGSEASASYSEGVLSLGIPAGPEGAPGQDGQDGVGIANVQLNSDYTLTITLTDGRTYTTTSIRGEQGETGLTPDFTIGTVTTLAPGSQATATITGTDEEPVLNLGIPKGDPGDVSSTGYYPELYAGGLVTDKGETDTAPYVFRASKSLGYREKLNQIVGGTVAWNQLMSSNDWSTQTVGGITFTNNGDGTYTINGTATGNTFVTESKPFVNNHVYYLSGCPKSGSRSTYFLDTGANIGGSDIGNGFVGKCRFNTGSYYVRMYVMEGTTVNNLTVIPQLTDLTAMFGTTIADYIYSLEQATAGAGVAWFKKLFPADYYEYNAGELISVEGLESHDTVGFNQWDEEWELGYINDNGDNVAYANAFRSKNYIRVIPDTSYCITTAKTMYMKYYDADKNYIGKVDKNGYGNVGSPRGLRTMPYNCAYIRFYIDNTNTYNNDICINLHWDGSRDGEYEPYVKHTYPLDSSLTLRGIPKLVDGKLAFDGDIYPPSGEVQRRYGVVDLGTLTWTKGNRNNDDTGYIFRNNDLSIAAFSDAICTKFIQQAKGTFAWEDIKVGCFGLSGNYIIIAAEYETASAFKTAMSGVYLIYELATPTTETADPYQQIQICDPDGTEAFVDYGVESGDRDVAIPCGHETFYPEDLKGKLEDIPDIPEAPASNGTYTLKAVRSNTGVVYSWVSG